MAANVVSQSETPSDAQQLYSGPAWNNSPEYPSMSSNEFIQDRATLESLIERLREEVQSLKPAMEKQLTGSALSELERDDLISSLQGISEVQEQATVLIWNMLTYVRLELCIDGQNVEAQKVQSQIVQLAAKLETATKPTSMFLDRAPEEVVSRYLSHPHTKPESFALSQSREWSNTLLSEQEETLLTSLRTHGPSAWGNLYDQISGTLRCKLEPTDGAQDGSRAKEVGLAQASGLLRDANESVRKSAWYAIQNAWKQHEHSAAAILNGLAGWRLEVNERRSATRPIHFLDQPLHSSRITRATLDAMLEAVRSEIEMPRRALRAVARGMGKSQVDPWDLLAPAPAAGDGGRRTFKDGLRLIHDSFAAVDGSFGDFIDTMVKNRWIEGRVLPSKRQGAFCTRFTKSRTPRVFQTYMGSISDIRTLAHELGHAYHAWVMRDLPPVLHHYPMTLAETASVFAETVFADHMLASGDENAQFEIAWQNAETAASFLLNIPARFEFERSFYEKRQAGFVTPNELCEMTESAWRKWYGDTLSKPESQFWMTKLHFSMAGRSFYNYPYTFGYLFSLGIYALRAQRGADFMPSYVSLLRDTGRMTAEDLVKTYLGEDITQPEFWKKSLAIVAKQVEHFEKLLAAREPARLRQ